MKVVVLGAAGAMASVVIKDLLTFAGDDIRITAADARPFEHNDRRVSSVLLDARDMHHTTRIVDGHDVALNCVSYYLNVPIMEACLNARVPYSDLGGLYHVSLKQFELHDRFVSAGIPAVLGMGSTPGITNIMAGKIALELDDVTELHVRIGCWDATVGGTLPVPYSLDTIFDEFTLQPYVFTSGSAKAVDPMSGAEPIEFPEPVGTATAIHTLHSEVAMFPRSFPRLRETSFKIAFPEDFVSKIRLLVDLGLASREPLINGVSPRQMLAALIAQKTLTPGEANDCDVLRVYARGTRSGSAVYKMGETIVLPHREWNVSAGSLDTGVPLSIVGQMLANRVIDTPGVLCPETSVAPDLFFSELMKRSIYPRFVTL